MYKIRGSENLDFDTREELVNYLSKFNYRLSGPANEKLDNAAVNKTDMRHNWSYFTEYDNSKQYVARSIYILDEEDNNMYCKAFIKEVVNYKFNEALEYKRVQKQWRDKLRNSAKCFRQPLPEFRSGPVALTRKSRGGPYCSAPSNYAEQRENVNPENKGFIRPKRLEKYEEIVSYRWYRQNQKSWKSQKKYPHQWEKKRSKGEYVVKYNKKQYALAEIE